VIEMPLWPLIIAPLATFFFGIVILTSIFWLWMLIDCLKRKKFDDKLVWVLVLIFLGPIGAVLYYFLVRSKKRR